MMRLTHEKIKNLGQIKSMDLPDGFVPDPMGSQLLLKEYISDKDDRVRFGFYYRGQRIPEYAGEAFKQILALPPHDLAFADLEPINLVVLNVVLPEYFDFSRAQTRDINGKRALVVEGYWKVDEVSSTLIYLDSDGTGTAVQEIHFVAPVDLYPHYLPIAQDALQSIRWK